MNNWYGPDRNEYGKFSEADLDRYNLWTIRGYVEDFPPSRYKTVCQGILNDYVAENGRVTNKQQKVIDGIIKKMYDDDIVCM